MLLRAFATSVEHDFIAALHDVVTQARFRHMSTRSGHQMSVAMTNCGAAGWVTDRSSYRYDGIDPQSGKPWPEMPSAFRQLAGRAAAAAALMNFYQMPA